MHNRKKRSIAANGRMCSSACCRSRADESDVRYHDVRKPLPFADKTFDAAYALHIIEHLTPAEAASLVNELYRVLKPGGILRISTPDLEDICRSYLQQFDECRTSRSNLNMVRYRWAVLEVLDQLVRERSGGLMAQACAVGDFDPEFAKRRYGDVFDEFSGARLHRQAETSRFLRGWQGSHCRR